MIELHDECGKIVHRPCSSCVSSIPELNENSIEFSLSTWTWNRFKLSWLEPYKAGTHRPGINHGLSFRCLERSTNIQQVLYGKEMPIYFWNKRYIAQIYMTTIL